MRRFGSRIGPAPIIIVTAFGNLETAVRAMEGGAFDYLVKPFDLDQAASRAEAGPGENRSRGPAESEPRRRPASRRLIGTSPAMQDLFKSIALVAPTDVPVLDHGRERDRQGAGGPGHPSPQPAAGGPFLPVCLAALSPGLVEGELFGHLRGSFTGASQDRKGLLELASGGTVLLDEVGDIPPALQVKLSRAIEHREVTPVGDARPRPTDIRVIAATNRPLAELMATGQFREDLFFRLERLPDPHPAAPRASPEDIPALAEHFLRQSNLPDVAEARPVKATCSKNSTSRPWVGNVRELQERHRARGDCRPGPLNPRASTSRRPPPARRPASSPTFGKSRTGLPAGPSRRAARVAPKHRFLRSMSDSSSWSNRRSYGRPSIVAAVIEPPPPSARHPSGNPSAEAQEVWPRLILATAQFGLRPSPNRSPRRTVYNAVGAPAPLSPSNAP